MNDAVMVVIAAQAVTAAVPLVLAGIGETLAQRAGVLNVGIEGLLLTGCVAGFTGAALTGCAWSGLAAAIVASALLAALFAWATVVMRCDQIVTGMAINLLAVGGSGTTWLVAQGHGHAELSTQAGFQRGIVPGISAETQAWLGDLPLIGPLVFAQYGLAAVTVSLAGAAWWVLTRTRAGVIIHALGDAPDACAANGIAVRRWRVGLVILAGALAGA